MNLGRSAVRHGRVSIALLVAALLSGCSVHYVIDRHVLETARKEAGSAGDRIAVPAQRITGAPVYLRSGAIDFDHARPIDSDHVIATAPYRAGYRVAGPTLLAIGAAALTAAIVVTAVDASSPCVYDDGNCVRGLLAAIVGLPLGLGGILLHIPGAILTWQGYRSPSEVTPPDRHFVYLPR
jgi:hypothetical protein